MLTVFTYENKDLISDDVFSSNLKFILNKDELIIDYNPDYISYDNNVKTSCSIKLEPKSRFFVIKKCDNSTFTNVVNDSVVYTNCSSVNFYEELGDDNSKFYFFNEYINNGVYQIIADILIGCIDNTDIDISISSVTTLKEDINIESNFYNIENNIQYYEENDVNKQLFNTFKHKFYGDYTLIIDNTEIRTGKFISRDDENNIVDVVLSTEVLIDVSMNGRDFIPIKIQKKRGGWDYIDTTRDIDNDTLNVTCTYGAIKNNVTLENGRGEIKYYPGEYRGKVCITLTPIPKKYKHFFPFLINVI